MLNVRFQDFPLCRPTAEVGRMQPSQRTRPPPRWHGHTGTSPGLSCETLKAAGKFAYVVSTKIEKWTCPGFVERW